MKTITFCLVFLLTISQLFAQEDNLVDPIAKYKSFYELGGSIGLTRVNTEHTHFNTAKGDYEFRKNNYLPSSTGSINFGWLFNSEESNTIFAIKTGINISTKSASLLDSDGNKLQLTTSYLQLPFLVGFREPIRYSKNENRFFHALEYHIGVYAATPFFQKLDNRNNVDASGKGLAANNLRFGIMAEVAFTAFDNKGHGHKFGFRMMHDFAKLHKFKKTPSQLYPYYGSLGLFYNIYNDYYK